MLALAGLAQQLEPLLLGHPVVGHQDSGRGPDQPAAGLTTTGAGHLLEVVAGTESRLMLDAFVLGVLATSTIADLGDDVAPAVADRYGCAVSFSGTVAAPDGRRWTIPVGHPGLGSSGSRDVLAGCVAGPLARGADPDQAPPASPGGAGCGGLRWPRP